MTDANLVLGRLSATEPFPGLGPPDVAAALAALERSRVDASGVVDVVNSNMEQALRRVSVERGVDPKGLTLVAFGGAGPLHACDLASILGITRVVVPPRAGVFSAVGIMCAPRQHDLVESWNPGRPTEEVEEAVAALGALAREHLLANSGSSLNTGGEVTVETAIDCRYAGQSHELRVTSLDEFHEEHRRRNGYARVGDPIEVIAIRATARVASPVEPDDLPPVERERAVGPAVISEPDCTIWIPDGWTATPHEATGALLITHGSATGAEA